MLEDDRRGTRGANVLVGIEQDEQQLRTLARIKRAVRRKTNGGIQKLSVSMDGEHLVLGGECISFYCKQLAQEIAMSYLEKNEGQLRNEIEVLPRPR